MKQIVVGSDGTIKSMAEFDPSCVSVPVGEGDAVGEYVGGEEPYYRVVLGGKEVRVLESDLAAFGPSCLLRVDADGKVTRDEERERRCREETERRLSLQAELAALEDFFAWYNTQAVQHLSGTVSDADFEALRAEYVATSARAKEIKAELGIQTETEKRSKEKEAEI